MLGTFWKLQKLIPSKKNPVLIEKISLRKTQKNRQSAKINSCKNFVPRGKSFFKKQFILICESGERICPFMHELDVLSPQAWGLCIILESWQI